MITIVDYKAGNLTSVKRALDHLGIENQISKDPDVVRSAERVIFPGVGAAGAAMEVLKERHLDSALKESFQRGTPILGICIGCQIILTRSEEGNTPGLNLMPGVCSRFQLEDEALKIPHMGWNAVRVTQPHSILRHLRPGDEFYFVHSYYPQPDDPAQIYAVCDYGGEFPVAIGTGNLFAVQFHAEKSGLLGLQLLKNFSEWRP
jgi:glutamine amidotransferase